MTEFFEKPDFHYGGKPSDTRLKKFYEILITLEKESKCRFIVDRSTKLSSTNLNLGLKFPLFKIGCIIVWKGGLFAGGLLGIIVGLSIMGMSEFFTYRYTAGAYVVIGGVMSIIIGFMKSAKRG
jgi:LytS/YehU family sensor histidine kinase